MSEIKSNRKKSLFSSWNIDKWVFISFISSILAISFYFYQLESGWGKPIFQEIENSQNEVPMELNYSESESLLVLTRNNEELAKIQCLTVENDLCGRSTTPYAYKYLVEHINIAQVDELKYIDQISYSPNPENVYDLQTNFQSYAQNKIKGYTKQRMLYIGLVGILFGLYIAIKFLGFQTRKKESE